MLFDKTLRQELGRNFAATIFVLLTIVISFVLFRTLGYASSGRVNPAEMTLFLFYTLFGYLSIVVSMSLYIAILAGLMRMYAESEMVIWFTAGQGWMGIVRSVLRFAVPVVVSIFLLELFVAPWAHKQLEDMRTKFEMSGNLDRLAVGQFQESADGKRVFFVVGNADQFKQNVLDGKDGGVRQVFLVQRTDTADAVVSAPLAQVQERNGQKMVVLQNGQQIKQNRADGSLQIIKFAELSLLLNTSAQGGAQGRSEYRAIPTLRLLQSSDAASWAEMFSRLGVGVSALILSLFACAVAAANPRLGKSLNYVYALLIFIFYLNMLGLAENWVLREKAGFLTLFVVLHLGMLLWAGLWLLKRSTNFSFFSLLTLRKS